MIGTLATDPYGPGFVIVKVAPCTSSGLSWCAPGARREVGDRRAIPTVFIPSAPLITGTMSPAS